MDNDTLSSGFIDKHVVSEESAYTDLQVIYTSSAAQSILYRCQRYGKFHVLKALKPEFRDTMFYEQALVKEFNIGYTLEHPNICRTLGWEHIPSLGNCILLEYVDGITLKEYLEQKKLTRQQAFKIINELCTALQYIHSKQILHRDLKPSNILITYNGNNVKLIDFGLSDCDDYEILKLPAGTKYYLAPEVLQEGISLDLRADIYSLGVIIGEMSVLLQDKHLAAISRKCTRRKREKRYGNAAEVAAALNSVSYKKFFIGSSVVALLAIAIGLYSMKNEFISVKPSPYPIYGNSVCNERCRQLLATEKLRMLHSKDSLKKHIRWKTDSLQLINRLEDILIEEFALPELRSSTAYRHLWESVQKEADRQLKEVKKAVMENTY